MTNLFTELEDAWSLRRMNATVNDWVLDVRKIIGVGTVETHSMDGDLHISFSWDDGKTFWRVRHVVPIPVFRLGDTVVLNARLNEVTKAIKRTVNKA